MADITAELTKLADRAYDTTQMALHIIEDASISDQVAQLENHLTVIENLSSLTDALRRHTTNYLLDIYISSWATEARDYIALTREALVEIVSGNDIALRDWWDVHSSLVDLETGIDEIDRTYGVEHEEARLLRDILLLDTAARDLSDWHGAPYSVVTHEARDLRSAVNKLRALAIDYRAIDINHVPDYQCVATATAANTDDTDIYC